MKTALLFALSSVLILTSCRKDSFILSHDAVISLSADTLFYDTVFTRAGSVTQSFKIINGNSQKLRLSSVKLMGGSSSAFKINVDGFSATEVANLEVEANDSLYVFVQVNIDPVSGSLPFIVRDSIQISFNGNNRLVQLEAWGQNAIFLRNKEISTNETWTNDLPFVIQGFLYVPANRILRIEEGCRIYVHADAPIVIDGTLNILGQRDTANRVYIQGDRLDEPYKNFPASWPGIYFRSSSRDNRIQHAVIKNSYQALALENPPPNSNPKLTLDDCIIDNAYDAGIISLNSSITARNCLISNCGKNVAIGKGGNYQFTHCTLVSYSNNLIRHENPVLSLSHTDGTNTASLDALFRNCIFWGENGLVDDEVVVVKSGSDNVVFDHNLWKVKTAPQNITANNIISNSNPLFDSVNTARNYYDFRLRTNSPAIDKGSSLTQLTTDLDGKLRTGIPDLGCFER